MFFGYDYTNSVNYTLFTCINIFNISVLWIRYTNSVNYTLFTCINKMRIYGSENRESSKPGSSR
jgi:hypothetical protein